MRSGDFFVLRRGGRQDCPGRGGAPAAPAPGNLGAISKKRSPGGGPGIVSRYLVGGQSMTRTLMARAFRESTAWGVRSPETSSTV